MVVIRNKILVIVVFLVHSLSCIPTNVSYQGYLSIGGLPFDGPTNISFEILNESSVPLWSENNVLLNVVDGVYNHSLKIPVAFLNPTNVYYLRVSVDGNDVSPNIPLMSVPYAYYARHVNWSNIQGIPAGFDDDIDNVSSVWINQGGNIYYTNNGNVGIGAVSPGAKLDIRDGTDMHVFACAHLPGFSNDNPVIALTRYEGIPGQYNSHIMTSEYNSGAGYGLSFKTTIGSHTLTDFDLNGAPICRLNIAYNGNVSIGTNYSPERFSVTTRNNGLNNDIDIARFDGNEDSETKEIMVLDKDGNVGIGIAAPRAALDLGDSTSDTDFRQIRLGQYWSVAETTLNNSVVMGFNAHLSSSSVIGGYNRFAPEFSGGVGIVMNQSANGIEFWGIDWGGSMAEKNFTSDFIPVMSLTADGSVGIGTMTPGAKLEVDGFTKLGADAPGVKVWQTTGVMPSAGGERWYPLPCTYDKVLVFQKFVRVADRDYPPAYGDPGANVWYQSRIEYNGSHQVYTYVPATGTSVANQSCRIIIFYTE